ncbi:family 20 glycosylhydrolase [Phyllobacterium chamaecytisi]|uniref:family 20 glycosylhydrolase n=1 Tax=Phyllobacterium chamaecytisi TaxID=2876082 RepID=UPI001CCC9C90|nr:family 20 glycosylhydrolase [Phyllobacterium sp. KW56]MBZ9600816.1 family 20 glycosylhydrolase [Phyllobacterium sp. KW56]
MRQIFSATTALSLCLAALFAQPHSAFSAAKGPLSTLQQKKRLDSDFALTKDTRIVLKEANPDLAALLDAPRGWAQKLRYATGLPLEIIMDTNPTANDIVLTNIPDQSFLDAAKSAKVNTSPGKSGNYTKTIEQNVLAEGYQFNISRKGVVIGYKETIGALRGFQSLTLMAMSDSNPAGKHKRIAGAEGMDYPLFENRRIMLDVARYYMPVDQLIGYMDKMSLHKLNELHLHLNDSAMDGTILSAEGFLPKKGYFRLYNEDKPRFKLIPTDGDVYTRKDWERLEAAAYRYGIKLVPEFDTPGHALAFAKDNPKLTYASNGDTIITKDPDKAVTYFADLIGEFKPWFKSDTIHIGGDEAWGNSHEDTVKYINKLYDRLARSPGNPAGFKNVWIWYEAKRDLWGGKFAESVGDFNKDINIAYWLSTRGLPTASDLTELSSIKSKWIDGEGSKFYFVPKTPIGFSSRGIGPEQAYLAYEGQLQRYEAYKTIPSGLQLSQWNDVSKLLNIGVDYINAGLSESIAGMGFISWSGLVYDKDSKVKPYKDTGYDGLIGVSQEMSSYWVRDRFPYFDGEQALQLLMQFSRHRQITTAWALFIPLPAPFDYLKESDADKDWMAWDTQDLAATFNGPVFLHKGTFVADLPGEGKAMTDRPDWICRDIGFALKERQTSACDKDEWPNWLSGEELGDLEKSGAGTLKLSGNITLKGRVRLDEGTLIVPKNSDLAKKPYKVMRNGGLLVVE